MPSPRKVKLRRETALGAHSASQVSGQFRNFRRSQGCQLVKFGDILSPFPNWTPYVLEQLLGCDNPDRSANCLVWAKKFWHIFPSNNFQSQSRNLRRRPFENEVHSSLCGA